MAKHHLLKEKGVRVPEENYCALGQDFVYIDLGIKLVDFPKV